MLQSYKSKSICIYDNGLFVELAIKLSEFFGKVYYYCPWKNAFPKSNSMLIGRGIPGIIKIDNFWDYLDDFDEICFPDVYDGDMQKHLESIGKRVWGSRKGEELELFRNETKQLLKSIGQPVYKYEVVIGLAALRKYLKSNNDQFVKVSGTRGDFETFEAPNYTYIEPMLDELEHKLGAKKYIMEFIVEAAIKDAVEVGYDGYCIDGQFPGSSLAGIEVKDRGYIGVFKKYSELPKEITAFNTAISPIMKKYKYRNFFSSELRIKKDHVPYMIDACCRCPSPPSELYQNMYENIADIIWFGAEGKCIDPICKNGETHGVEVMIHSPWADEHWQPVQFPKEIREFVKLRNVTIIDGKYYVVPQGVGLPEIGAIVATGKTREEALAKCKEYSDQVKGYYIDIQYGGLDDAEVEFEKLEKMNIKL